jgi:hypothetical protein
MPGHRGLPQCTATTMKNEHAKLGLSRMVCVNAITPKRPRHSTGPRAAHQIAPHAPARVALTGDPFHFFKGFSQMAGTRGLPQCSAVTVRRAKERCKARAVRDCQLASHPPNLLIDGTRIVIAWDEPMRGVGRPWFECPKCSRRCRHVYLRDTIACRRCHGLQRAVRHLRRQTPGVGRVERLRRKLGGCDVRPFAPLPPLRRGRSRAYHEKLVAMIHAEETKLLGHLGSVVHDLDRRIRVRKAKGKW